MKSLQNILDNYSDYQTVLDDRFGKRLCQFLTAEQVEQIDYSFNTPEARENHKPVEFTERAVIEQLLEDAEFGKEKAENQRGISSSFMYVVCKAWCNVLEKPELVIFYDNYGIKTFDNILNRFSNHKNSKDDIQAI